jgi:hypothetical protein
MNKLTTYIPFGQFEIIIDLTCLNVIIEWIQTCSIVSWAEKNISVLRPFTRSSRKFILSLGLPINVF